MGCNKFNQLIIDDPSGICIGENGHAADRSMLENSKACGLGLMQSTELPYTYWEAQGGQTGGDLTPEQMAKVCFVDYNPFNSTHSACVGTYKIYAKMKNSEGAVDSLITKYGEDLPDLFAGEKRRWWLAAYTAAAYYGIGSSTMTTLVNEYIYLSDGSDGTCKVPHEVQVTDGEGKPAVDENGKPITEVKYTDEDFKDFPDYMAVCKEKELGKVGSTYVQNTQELLRLYPMCKFGLPIRKASGRLETDSKY
jgi:hypothetical protein